MPYYEIEVSLLKDEGSGKAVGVNLVAQSQTEAELFCASFPPRYLSGEAKVTVEGVNLHFEHPVRPDFIVKIPDADALALNETFTSDSIELGVFRTGALTPGFAILPKDKTDQVREVKVELD